MRLRGGSLIAVTAVVGLLSATPATAKTFDVTRHNDPVPGPCKPADCSLREAILAANNRPGRDVVALADRTPRYKLTRANNVLLVDEDASIRGDLDVTGPITFIHPGRGRATIDASGIDRVLEVLAATTIKRVKLTGGANPSESPPIRARAPRRGNPAGAGAGIEAVAPLTLIRSAVVGNTEADGGGGIEISPGSDPSIPSSLRLVRSIVARNSTASSGGGAIRARETRVTIARSRLTGNESANNSGAMRVSDGTLRMRSSTIAANQAQFDAAGVSLFDSTAWIRQSTISGNEVVEMSGSGGAGIALGASQLTIVNSTVARNRTPSPAGGIGTDLTAGNVVTMNSVTVARNDAAGPGGGLSNENNAATWNVVNSIVALNQSGDGSDNCSGTFTSGGGNLIGLGTGCTGFSPPNDILLALGVSPKLGTLAHNGGPTNTMRLKKGSPAIGKAVKSEAPKRDQRGVKRDAKPDIGAYER